MSISKKNLAPYWEELSEIEAEFSDKVMKLEEKMSKEFGMELEFFMCDGEYCGVGNPDRTMRLIHR